MKYQAIHCWLHKVFMQPVHLSSSSAAAAAELMHIYLHFSVYPQTTAQYTRRVNMHSSSTSNQQRQQQNCMLKTQIIVAMLHLSFNIFAGISFIEIKEKWKMYWIGKKEGKKKYGEKESNKRELQILFYFTDTASRDFSNVTTNLKYPQNK